MTTTLLPALTLLAISTMAEYTNPEETTTTCEAPKAAKIQHTGESFSRCTRAPCHPSVTRPTLARAVAVFFKFPELVEGSADAAKMQEIVTEKFSSMPGIIAQVSARATPRGSRC